MTQLAIVIIVVLLPGILATAVADKLTVHSKWDSFKFALYALVLGILTYSVLQLFAFVGDFLICVWKVVKSGRPGTVDWAPLGIWKIAQNGNSSIPSWEIVTAVFLSIPVAFIAAACIQHKVITRLGNFLYVTSKYGDENLYSYFMNANETDWIYVRDKDSNLTYQGRVAAYSENDHIHELVLHDVTVYRYDDSAKLYSVPAAYLSKEFGKLAIEAVPQELLREVGTDDGQAVN